MSAGRLAALGASALACAASCAAHRQAAPSEPSREKVTFGVYRGSVTTEDGGSARFRLLLYAALPAALHAELLPPVGGPLWILDSGEGRLSVTDVREGVAYVGDAGPEALDRALGVRASVADLVAALLNGAALPPPAEGLRQPAHGTGLPARFEVCGGGQCFRIERKRTKRARPTAPLGTGEPPRGLRLAPLEDLPTGGTPAILVREGGAAR